MNQQGGGTGGFEWLNYDNSNVLTSPNPLMTLDSGGNVNVFGYIKKTPVYYSAWFNTMSAFAPTIASTWTLINFSSYITSGITTASSSSFTVPVTSSYKIQFNMNIGCTKGSFLAPYVNGVAVKTFNNQYTTLTNYNNSGSWILVLTAGDVVEFKFMCDFVTALYLSATDDGAGLWVYCPTSTYSVEMM